MTWATIFLISSTSNIQAEQAKVNSLAVEPGSSSTQVVQAEAKQPATLLMATSSKEDESKVTVVIDDTKYDAVVKFLATRYPQTASHIMIAMAKGKPAVCKINRSGADGDYKKHLLIWLRKMDMIVMNGPGQCL